jgi:hypothetical protein
MDEHWNQSKMRLADFRTLISAMPVPYQAFASKRSTWVSQINRGNEAGNALRSIFGPRDEVAIVSRSDLRSLGTKSDLAQFVMATILWGYPGGMRGNHVANLIDHFDSLTHLLSAARAEPVDNWKEHYAKVGPITGIGLSTYTKFLHFLSVKVQGHAALILDDRIIQVANRGTFAELAPLEDLSSYHAPRLYPKYLQCMHDTAAHLSVSAEQIEFFLFEFGLDLKTPGT